MTHQKKYEKKRSSVLTLMVEFSQSPGAHSYQNEEEDERPQNFHNKSHLEWKERGIMKVRKILFCRAMSLSYCLKISQNVSFEVKMVRCRSWNQFSMLTKMRHFNDFQTLCFILSILDPTQRLWFNIFCGQRNCCQVFSSC